MRPLPLSVALCGALLACGAVSAANSRALLASASIPNATTAVPPPVCGKWSSIYGCLDPGKFDACDANFGLSPAGYGYCYSGATEDLVVVGLKSNQAWLRSNGSKEDYKVVKGLAWLSLAIAALMLLFFAWSTFKATCGWEEVYVCTVELIFCSLELTHHFDSPATIYLSTGNSIYAMRYCEWLLTCPVILIHLSNLSGMKNDYSKRTMRLLVSVIGMIVFGFYGALSSETYLKWIFFLIGCAYASVTFTQAAKCFVESYIAVPKGVCRQIVKAMAYILFITWTGYTVMFIIGPDGLYALDVYQSTIITTILDILSKQVWTFLGHILRIKIHEHIIIHGDIRKKTKLKIAGDEVEVEEFVDEDDEDGVKQDSSALANRNSFVIMRDRLKARGENVRLSLHDSHSNVGPGRIILSVTDFFIAQTFQQQFQQLPSSTFGQIELIPAIGEETTLQLAQQAMMTGGCDFVLIHPEFLRNSNLLSKLRGLGVRLVAFGPSQGPLRDLVDSSGVDGWVEGPPLHPQQLERIIVKMQMDKKMQGLGMGIGMGMGQVMPPSMVQSPPSYEPLLSSRGGQGQPPMMSHLSMGGGYGQMVPASPNGMAPPAATPPSSEAEMMSQLMAEINRLKGELGA